MTKVARGSLLIASPDLLDPNFHRTVVLLCEHSPQGSVGLVLNRATETTLQEAVPGLPEASGRDEPIYQGGPVQPDHLLVLHRDEELEGEPVLDGVRVGGEPSILRALLAGPPDPEGDRFRCYAGYAGWGEGQLDAEIEEGAWVVVEADERLVFEVPVPDIWAEALRKKGGVHRLVAEMPRNPELN